MPWQHFAKRVEIDSRLQTPQWEGDRSRAMAEDLAWRFTEALHAGRLPLAEDIRRELDEYVVQAESADPYFDGGTMRWDLVEAALSHGVIDQAVREFEAWRSSANMADLDTDNTRRTNARQLASRLIAFLEDPALAGSPDRDHVWAMLRELMPHLSEVATGPQSEAFARLTRAMSGGNEAEEQLISRLERLRADDVRRPPRGLPPDTPFRMQVIARRDFTAGTGIPSGLVWDVCMAPYLASQMSDPARFAASLAAAVAGAGQWAVVGASRLMQEFDMHRPDNPAFLGILDESLAFLHEKGFSSGHLRRTELDRWLDTHGPSTWDQS